MCECVCVRSCVSSDRLVCVCVFLVLTFLRVRVCEETVSFFVGMHCFLFSYLHALSRMCVNNMQVAVCSCVSKTKSN